MRLEEEKGVAVLAAVMSIGGGRKDQVLDSVAANGYLAFDEHDLETMNTRDEAYWRNDLAYIRKHLVERSRLSKLQRNK